MGLLCAVVPAAAQSLADVAKKEQERRAGVEAPGKTYRNVDLTPDPARASVGEEPASNHAGNEAVRTEPAEPNAGDALVAPVSSEAAAAAPADGDTALNEGIWRSRANVLRARVERARKELDLVSRPEDGDERQQARTASVRASAEGVLARAQSAWDAFERAAREVGVPEGWIR